MNLLFSMSLAGSLVLLIYLAIKPAAERYLSAAWRFGLLKVALLFYLLPYQYLKYGYASIVKSLFPGLQLNPEGPAPHVTASMGRMILVDSAGHIHFRNQTFVLSILGIWAAFTIIYLLYNLIKYVNCMRDLQQITKKPVPLPDAATGQCHSRRLAKAKASIYASRHIATPFTVGVLHPRILLPSSLVGKKECQMIISHELAHVRNQDNLIKFICLVAILLHWYNPFIYFLYWEICKVSEQVCDAAVIRDRTEQEIEQYKLLIIELGQKGPHIDTLWSSPFNGRFKMIKERMIAMNNTTHSSKKTRIAASLLAVVLLLALSPISVLAYSPAPTCECENQQDNIADTTLYFPTDQTDTQEIGDSLIEYEVAHGIFIDADGQSYVLSDSAQVGRLFCPHDWVSGKVYAHTKHDNGGCTVSCYNGQRCSLCGSYKLKDLISTTTYVKCPH